MIWYPFAEASVWTCKESFKTYLFWASGNDHVWLSFLHVLENVWAPNLSSGLKDETSPTDARIHVGNYDGVGGSELIPLSNHSPLTATNAGDTIISHIGTLATATNNNSRASPVYRGRRQAVLMEYFNTTVVNNDALSMFSQRGGQRRGLNCLSFRHSSLVQNMLCTRAPQFPKGV